MNNGQFGLLRSFEEKWPHVRLLTLGLLCGWANSQIPLFSSFSCLTSFSEVQIYLALFSAAAALFLAVCFALNKKVITLIFRRQYIRYVTSAILAVSVLLCFF